jgi:hypothetical protein
MEFQEYIKKGIVKKQNPNVERALSLLRESKEKKKFLETLLKNVPEQQMNANFIVDYCYDIIMELLRAKMFIEGYNPGNSHEAEVSYMLTLGFIQADVTFMDEIRYYRNGTKYYGKILNMEYARKVLEFTKTTFPKLKNMLNFC